MVEYEYFYSPGLRNISGIYPAYPKISNHKPEGTYNLLIQPRQWVFCPKVVGVDKEEGDVCLQQLQDCLGPDHEEGNEEGDEEEDEEEND